MDYLILLYGLLISVGVLLYLSMVWKLASWVDEKISSTLGFCIWIMGFAGVPLSIVASLIPMP